jgi:hypothetical protein
MGFTVTWTEEAMADFMEIWTSSSDKAALTAAARYVDQLLQREPFHQRYEVIRGSGVVVHAPLAVDFWLDEANRNVYVTAAWPFSEVE